MINDICTQLWNKMNGLQGSLSDRKRSKIDSMYIATQLRDHYAVQRSMGWGKGKPIESIGPQHWVKAGEQGSTSKELEAG